MVDIFFDVDGCLIDQSYKENMDAKMVRDRVKSRPDYTFHINSNRSIEKLLEFYEKFGFNGRIITENGISVYEPLTKKVSSFDFSKFDKTKLVDIIKSSLNVEVQFIDTDKLLSSPSDFFGLSPENGLICFCERTREYTMTVYPRMIINGEFTCNEEMLKSIFPVLKRFYPEYDLEIGTAYGNLLLVPKNAKKGTLIPAIANERKTASFGDGNADISMFEVSDFCGAPENASETVKKKVIELGGFVSEKRFTQAAYEFIQKVDERFKK